MIGFMIRDTSSVPSEVPIRAGGRKLAMQVLRYALGLIAAAVALSLVFGRRGELSGAVATLAHLRVAWVVVAAVAEMGSVTAYAALYRRLLRCGGENPRLRLGALTSITLAANSIQNSLPAGPAWSNLYAFRQFRRRGADPLLCAWTLVLANVLAFTTLGMIALAGVLAAEGQASSLGLVQVVVGVAVVGLVLVFGLRRGLLAGPGLAVGGWVVRASQKVFHRPLGDPQTIVLEAWDRLGAVHPSKRALASATAWALANWLFDLTCLGLAFSAVGSPIPWRGLLLAYGAGQLAANLPLTPGGLGVVEGSLTVALVYYGGAQSATVAAVLLYRILSFWLALPIGWVAALVLRIQGRQSRVPSGLAASTAGPR
jgi:uncharacterized protein (TIRG00374 family)